MKTVICGMAGFGLLLVALHCAAVEASEEKIISKAFVVEPGGAVAVDVDQGNIEIVVGKQNVVEVVVERTVAGRSASQAARILKNHRVAIAQEGNHIVVEAKEKKKLREPDLEVHFKITVPRKFDARLDTAGGAIQVTGLQGAVEARSGGGDLNVTNIGGDLNGQTGGGNIRATGCAGKTQVRTSGGNITIESFTGPGVQADTAGGNINVTGCAGTLAIKTSGGNITVDNFTGPAAYADTAGGTIAVDLAGALLSDSWFRTGGGNITVKVAQTVGAKVNAVTQGGKITATIPITATGEFKEGSLQGRINEGGPALQLRTSGGDIEISKR